MKKYIALILTFVVITVCFAACGKEKLPEVDGAQVYTDVIGNYYPVSTEADGSVTRNDNGEIELMVTDEDGKNVTDADGNYVTEIADLENGLVIGERIEYTKFSVFVPSEWQATNIYSGCTLKKNGRGEYMEKDELPSDWEGDSINICEIEKPLEEVAANGEKIQQAIADTYPDAKIKTDYVKVHSSDCKMYASFVSDNGEGKAVFLANIYYDNNNGHVYSFSVSSNRDMTDDMTEVLEILNSIYFYA